MTDEEVKQETQEQPEQTEQPASETVSTETEKKVENEGEVSDEGNSERSEEEEDDSSSDSSDNAVDVESVEDIEDIEVLEDEDNLIDDVETKNSETDDSKEEGLPEDSDITKGGDRTVAGRPFVNFNDSVAYCYLKPDSRKRWDKSETSKNGKKFLRYTLNVYFKNDQLGEYFDGYGGLKSWLNDDQWGEPSPNMKGMNGKLSLAADLFLFVEKYLTKKALENDPNATKLYEERDDGSEVHRLTLRQFYDFMLKGFKCKIKKIKVVNNLGGKESINFKNFPAEVISEGMN